VHWVVNRDPGSQQQGVQHILGGGMPAGWSTIHLHEVVAVHDLLMARTQHALGCSMHTLPPMGNSAATYRQEVPIHS
jgi:hypothetical protein